MAYGNNSERAISAAPAQLDATFIPVVLIVFYFVGTMLSIANYVAYVRYHEERYGRDVKNAYLVFTVLGTIIYAIWSGICWLWAARYSNTVEDRTRRIGYGFWGIFLLHDLPLFIIEFHMVLCCGGLHHGLQGFVHVVQWIEFMLSFIWAWSTYTWFAAGIMQSNFGDNMALQTGREKVMVVPYVQHISPRDELSAPLMSSQQRQISPTPVRKEHPVLVTRTIIPSSNDGAPVRWAQGNNSPPRRSASGGYQYLDQYDEDRYEQQMPVHHTALGHSPPHQQPSHTAYHYQAPREMQPRGPGGGGYHQQRNVVPQGSLYVTRNHHNGLL